jgi:putative endonuclease
MTGLVPAIHVFLNTMMAGGWFYFMTNRRNKRYGLKMLVYYQRHDDIRSAIRRESTVKHWPRAWKVRLIHSENPEWKDLYDTLI